VSETAAKGGGASAVSVAFFLVQIGIGVGLGNADIGFGRLLWLVFTWPIYVGIKVAELIS
jgi:hypothetical protein